MNKSLIKATALRSFLLIIVFVLLGLLVGGFYYAQNWLNDIAINSLTDSSQSIVVDTNNQELKELQNDIANQQVAAGKAVGMIASSQNYQNQIKQDLDKYATDNSIVITSYAASQPPSVATRMPLIGGLQLNYLSVTIKNPVSYPSLYKFIKAIETNIPKLQIMGINISHSADSNNSINVEPLILEVYTR